MRRNALRPSPVALLSGILLYGLLFELGAVASAVVPKLLELLKTEPRLAMAGFLALIIHPAVLVVLVHHVGHRVLDGAGSGAPRAILPKVESWWAGAHAWLVLYGTSVLARLAVLIVYPPEPEGDALVTSTTEAVVTAVTRGLTDHVSVANVASTYTLFWILIASALYQLERAARKGNAGTAG